MKGKDSEFAEAIYKVVTNNGKVPIMGSGFFERADFEALVMNLPEYLRDFTRFGFITGWRKSQIAKLQWSHIVDRAGAARR